MCLAFIQAGAMSWALGLLENNTDNKDVVEVNPSSAMIVALHNSQHFRPVRQSHSCAAASVQVCFLLLHNIMTLSHASRAACVAGRGIESTSAAYRAQLEHLSCARLGSAILSDLSTQPDIAERINAARTVQLISLGLTTHKEDAPVVKALMSALNNTTHNNDVARAAFLEAGGARAAIEAAKFHAASEDVMSMGFHGLKVRQQHSNCYLRP